MKVYYNGSNIYQQFSTNETLIEKFNNFTMENLVNIEVSYTFGVLLVANSLHIYGANLKQQPKIINFPKKIQQISCNDKHILILLENNDLVKLLKDNLDDIIDLKLIENCDEIQRISCGCKINIAQTKCGKFYNLPNKLEFENCDIIDVQTGRDHCLLLDCKGNVYSFGIGSRGQLGHGSLDDECEPKQIEALAGIRIKSIACGGWHSCAISIDGDLYIWGWNSNGQLGINDEKFTTIAQPQVIDDFGDKNVLFVACGVRHTIVLLETNQLYGCGWNKYKQLNSDNIETYPKMTILQEFSNEKIIKLKCGPWNSLILCQD